MIAVAGAIALAALTGCSTATSPDATAGIAPTVAQPTATATPAPDGTVAAGGTAPTQPVAAQGTAVPVTEASCEALKAELATATADKIPQKLAQFGQAKYVPTAEESARFARYVEVSKTSKAKCGVAATATKKSKQAATANKKKTTAEPAGGDLAPAATGGTIIPAPADGGVTTTMDSSG